MGILEVILLFLGVVLAVLSFVLPAARGSVDGETKVLAKEEIKTLVDAEMDNIRKHVDDVVDEAIEYAIEKTERSLSRITNEKIMAVHEYSDTVLQEIHKNHEETMFLYDMLNAKHDNLKETIAEAGKSVQEAKDAMGKMATMQESPEELPRVQPAEFERLDISRITKVQKPDNKQISGGENSKGKNGSGKKTGKKSDRENSTVDSAGIHNNKELEGGTASVKEWDFRANAKNSEVNNNEQILQLYKQGKTEIAIARELGLGVGEVKLVIELYKNS